MKNSPKPEGQPAGRSLADAPPSDQILQPSIDECPEGEFDLTEDRELTLEEEVTIDDYIQATRLASMVDGELPDGCIDLNPTITMFGGSYRRAWKESDDAGLQDPIRIIDDVASAAFPDDVQKAQELRKLFLGDDGSDQQGKP